MNNQLIDSLIHRAARAWMRNPRFNGRAAVLGDSDIIVQRDKEIVELRDGDEVIARYAIRSNGELRLLTKNLQH